MHIFFTINAGLRSLACSEDSVRKLAFYVHETSAAISGRSEDLDTSKLSEVRKNNAVSCSPVLIGCSAYKLWAFPKA